MKNKFKIWDAQKKRWLSDFERCYLDDEGDIFIETNSYSGTYLERVTGEVVRFTGLKDKNINDIYEGDIVKCHDHPTGVDDVTSYVEFKYGSFIIAYNSRMLSDYGTAWTEVIGNIYEHPHLLTKTQPHT